MASLLPFEPPAGYARVAVERGIDAYPDGLTYAIPGDLASITAGERVEVPLGRGNRTTSGYVVEILPDAGAGLDPERIKPIAARDETGVRLPGNLIRLAQWVSRYYCAPIGMTLASMIPAAVRKNVGMSTKRMVALADGDPPPKLSPKQRAVLEALRTRGDTDGPIEMRELADRAGLRTLSPIQRLAERGAITVTTRTSIEAAWAERAVDRRVPDALTPAQQHVVDAIDPTAGRFAPHLLRGVTGAGKTEVYIRLIERMLARGRTSLVLVPEISLTPQTSGRLLGRFPDHRVAVLHSGLTAAQRHQQWSLVLRGAAPIVIGARSAVFAPIPDGALGLVIVDEEHDDSFKQDQVPRYHGRDVAIRRAQLAECPIVLGSATPSLESWHNATVRQTFTLHELNQRAPGLTLPRVHVLDFAEQRKQHHDKRVHLLGPVLVGALGESLRRGGQSIILLNRRGYANYIACPDQMCGWVMQCDDCDVTMVYHLQKSLATGGFVRCHHCDSAQRLPKTCPDCGRAIVTFGLGTQRVEEELTRTFPELIEGETLVRVDSDTMRNARDFHAVLDRFGSGAIRTLVGTQMIAKGLDFPGVDLVGVVNADTALSMPDFRASERTFQLVSQVAGRSGRSSTPGSVVVQSFNPEVPAIQLAARHDYVSFANAELAERQACHLPPYTRMCRIVVRDADHDVAVRAATQLGEQLSAVQREHDSIRLRGPMPCPIARVAGRHRLQIEILAADATALQRFLTDARNRGAVHAGAQMAIDVDPISLL